MGGILRFTVDMYPANPLLLLPHDACRIVCVANTPGRAPHGALHPGDFVVHCNTAVHADALMRIPGLWHAVLCRHHTMGVRRPGYFTPASFDGFCVVHFTPTVNGWSGSPWWETYTRSNPGQCPTTGFCAYRLAQEAARVRGLPVVLLGYRPGRGEGTYRARCHAWEYEAAVYEREKAVIVNLNE